MSLFNKSRNQPKSLYAFGIVATLGLLVTSNPVQAATIVNRAGFTDTQFQDTILKGQFSELFVAEGRAGNNGFGGNGERELGINKAITPVNGQLVGGAPVASGDRVWGDGSQKLVDFSLEYTGQQVNYIVDGQTLTSSSFSGPVTDIFFRTFALANSNQTSNKNNLVQLSDLKIYEPGNSAGQALGSLSALGTATSNDVEYLQISDVTAGFKITGKTSLSWTGDAPTKSRLAYQIKVGSTLQKQVPEPGTTGALLLTGLVFLGCRKKATKALKCNVV